MTTLHEQLTAAIDKAERYAQIHAEDYEQPNGRAIHNLAGRMLRGLAEDRDILARHHAVDPWLQFCAAHNPDDGVLLDNCPEVLSLARRHGVEVTR